MKCRFCKADVPYSCTGSYHCNPLKKRGSRQGLLGGFSDSHRCSCCGSDRVVARRSLPRCLELVPLDITFNPNDSVDLHIQLKTNEMRVAKGCLTIRGTSIAANSAPRNAALLDGINIKYDFDIGGTVVFPGDADRDGDVDFTDFSIVAGNFTGTIASAAARRGTATFDVEAVVNPFAMDQGVISILAVAIS